MVRHSTRGAGLVGKLVLGAVASLVIPGCAPDTNKNSSYQLEETVQSEPESESDPEADAAQSHYQIAQFSSILGSVAQGFAMTAKTQDRALAGFQGQAIADRQTNIEMQEAAFHAARSRQNSKQNITVNVNVPEQKRQEQAQPQPQPQLSQMPHDYFFAFNYCKPHDGRSAEISDYVGYGRTNFLASEKIGFYAHIVNKQEQTLNFGMMNLDNDQSARLFTHKITGNYDCAELNAVEGTFKPGNYVAVWYTGGSEDGNSKEKIIGKLTIKIIDIEGK